MKLYVSNADSAVRLLAVQTLTMAKDTGLMRLVFDLDNASRVSCPYDAGMALPVAGDYFTVALDGTESWAAREAFEASYHVATEDDALLVAHDQPQAPAPISDPASVPFFVALKASMDYLVASQKFVNDSLARLSNPEPAAPNNGAT